MFRLGYWTTIPGRLRAKCDGASTVTVMTKYVRRSESVISGPRRRFKSGKAVPGAKLAGWVFGPGGALTIIGVDMVTWRTTIRHFKGTSFALPISHTGLQIWQGRVVWAALFITLLLYIETVTRDKTWPLLVGTLTMVGALLCATSATRAPYGAGPWWTQ